MRKQGLANVSALLMRAWSDSEAILGVTVLSRARVHIDLAVCYLVVGLWHPDHA